MSKTTNPNLKNCIDLYEWFDGYDIEDSDRYLRGQFFPHEKEAKDLCRTCPALQWCIDTHSQEPYTIIGGMTPSERNKRNRK